MSGLIDLWIKTESLANIGYRIAGMFGGGNLVANLANEHNFAKLKPSKRHMHII